MLFVVKLLPFRSERLSAHLALPYQPARARRQCAVRRESGLQGRRL